MDLGIKGRRALVAGGSSGIGLECARLLLREGVRLCIVGRGEEKLLAAAESLKSEGGEVITVSADLSTTEGIEKCWAEAERRFGGIDILVNNGGGPKSGRFEALSDDDWQSAFELTLMNTVRMTRRALGGMSERRWGRIVNIQSTSVKQPVDNLMLSNALRMAVIGFSKTLGLELPGLGITINTVAPGYAATDRLEQIAAVAANREGVDTKKVMEKWALDVPLRRIGRPDEVAAAVVFLASEAASYIHGVVLPVDGGRTRASL